MQKRMRRASWSWWLGLWCSVFLVPAGGIIRAADHVDDPRILESSGLVASQRVEDRFWTHNDSGYPARLFALDGPERRVVPVDIGGAESVDWEDIASGVIDGRPTLIIADVGDNARRRDHVTLYLVDEPLLSDTRHGDNPNEVGEPHPAAKLRRQMDVRYPDGPRDCEAIALDAEGRRVIMVSKQMLPRAGVYAVPIPAEGGNRFGDQQADRGAVEGDTAPPAVVAERISTLPLPMATGMDIRHDGLQMAVVGYFDLFLFNRDETEDWQAALRRVPVHIPLPKLKQIEAVCFDRHGDIWITSEGNPMPIARVRSSPKGQDDRNRDEVPDR